MRFLSQEDDTKREMEDPDGKKGRGGGSALLSEEGAGGKSTTWEKLLKRCDMGGPRLVRTICRKKKYRGELGKKRKEA